MDNILDAQYGVVGRRAGNAVRYLETRFRPLSLFCLNDGCEEHVEDLKKLQTAKSLRVLSHTVRLIWVVDAGGRLHVAFEELVDPNLGPTGTIFHPGMVLPSGIEKLGHPSLVQAREARIAGEVYLDDFQWIVNNKSGRFGLLPDRSASQLSNVATMFEQRGLSVLTDFLKPR